MTNNSSLQVIVTGGQEQAENGSLIHTPAVVYISSLMIFGLVGNTFVCYYYTFKELSKSTNTFFIIVLSVYNLLTCFITMPSEIAMVAFYYTFVNNIACKILRYVSYFLIIASLLTLVVIATNRYKRIGLFARPQMDMPQARRVSVFILVLSIFLQVHHCLCLELTLCLLLTIQPWKFMGTHAQWRRRRHIAFMFGRTPQHNSSLLSFHFQFWWLFTALLGKRYIVTENV